VIDTVNRANTACESRHAGSVGGSNRRESGTVELTRGHQVVHYGGTPTFIWIAPTATRPLPGDPTKVERSVRTEPRPRRPAKAAGTWGDAGGSTEAPCQRGSWRAGVARLPKRTGCPPA
jgi:hypothetical protein